MDAFETMLNTQLLNVYRLIEKLEEEMLRASKNIPLSISELHLLEAVALEDKGGGATISEISVSLDISLPSVTLAVNKLVRKGYVTKEKCGSDGRVVRVRLTREGRRAEAAHRYFHRSMVRNVTQEMTAEEKDALTKGVGKLETFLERNIQKYEEMA